MCGIVGFVGHENAVEILLAGLRHLEYRGYDSAGLSVIDGGLKTVRSVGKVANLAEKTGNLRGFTGIAHTRWATHGAPLEKNAHPHLDRSGKFAVVHNGIIENYGELRRKLEGTGVEFASDTDSEVIAHLIAGCYDGDLAQAVAAAIRQLHGTYGIAVISEFHPETIVCVRNGSPIVLGVGHGANMVASDITALVAHTRNVIYLQDGELAVLTPAKLEVRDWQNLPVEREISRITWDVAAAGKGGFDHYMLKEIHEQPEAVANTLRGRLDRRGANVILSGLNLPPRELAQFGRIIIAACGSSLHAGLIGEYFFEDIAGIPTEVEQAAEFRYRNPILESNTLVLPISQSGETADTLAAVREALNKGATVAAIANVVGSTIAREAGRGIYLHAGPEISVASTKGFSCQVAALLMLALHLGRNRRVSFEDGLKLLDELESLPDLIRQVIAEAGAIEKIAKKYAKLQDFFFIGRGVLYPVALEGALKLKEISYVHAEGYHAAELKHGPIALLDKHVPVIALANAIPGRDKLLGNIQECVARRSPVIAVTTGDDPEVAAMTSDLIRVPAGSRWTAPLTTVVALQLFAYFFARERGCEIDQPKNLAKSVTVE